MQFSKTERQNEEKSWDNPWDEQVSQEILKRVSDFMREDDESFFRRTIQGLTLAEIEEFLIECPEFRNRDKKYRYEMKIKKHFI